VLVALPVGAVLAWKRGDLGAAVGRLWVAAAASLALALLAVWLNDLRAGLAMVGYALGAWAILGSLAEPLGRAFAGGPDLRRVARRLLGLPRATWAMVLAHVGLGVLVIGVTATSTAQNERILTLRPGETAEIAGYAVRFEGVREVQGPNWIAQRGTFDVTRAGAPVTKLASDKRFFVVERRPTTEAGIHTTLGRDLYLVLGDPAGDGAWTVRLYHNPLVVWIWGGAVLMALGGLLSLSDRRFRVGAPRPARAPLAVPAE
jgi:cytochrome c-type biogenesis protein CcmF